MPSMRSADRPGATFPTGDRGGHPWGRWLGQQPLQPRVIQHHLLMRRLPEGTDLLGLSPGCKDVLPQSQGNEGFEMLSFGITLADLPVSYRVPGDREQISQNRQAAKDRIKADLDYQINVKAEMEMSAMAEQMHDIEQKLHRIHHDVLEARGGRERECKPLNSCLAASLLS
jgi:uncharacterized protein DUF1003